MKEEMMLMCLIAFVIGYLVARMVRGNGLMVGGQNRDDIINELNSRHDNEHSIIDDLVDSQPDRNTLIRIMNKKNEFIAQIENAIYSYRTNKE